MKTPHTDTHRDAMDPSILLCRDRLEISLEFADVPIRRTDRARNVGNAVGLAAATLAICAGGYLAHIVR
jgi:hypothetical protein